MDQLLLYCFHYDPATGKYGAVVMNMIRLGGIATVVAMLTLLLLLRRRGPATTGEQAGETVNPEHRYGADSPADLHAPCAISTTW